MKSAGFLSSTIIQTGFELAHVENRENSAPYPS